MADVSQISTPDRAASGSTGTPSRLTSPPRRATADTSPDRPSWRHCPEQASPDEITHDRNMKRLRELPDVRVERIHELRQAIANGSLETPERLATAIQRMIAENTAD